LLLFEAGPMREMRASSVECRSVEKRFDEVQVLIIFSIEVLEGAFLVLLGLSGFV